MKKLLFTLASVAFLSYTMTSCVKDEEPIDNNKTATGIVGKWNTDEMNLVISDSITGMQLMDTTWVYGQGEMVQEFTEDGMAITTDVEGSDTAYYNIIPSRSYHIPYRENRSAYQRNTNHRIINLTIEHKKRLQKEPFFIDKVIAVYS